MERVPVVGRFGDNVVVVAVVWAGTVVTPDVEGVVVTFMVEGDAVVVGKVEEDVEDSG